MDRRQFLARTGAVGALGVSTKVLSHPLLNWSRKVALSDRALATSPKRLVLLTLYGGADPLTSVVPYTDSAYYSQRASIAVAANSVLPLGEGLGLNPALSGMKSLWDGGQLAVIRGIGYPNPDYSHFRSMDIWQSASPNADIGTGWLGRWLDKVGAHPLNAMWVGSNVPLALVGATTQASAVLPNLTPSVQSIPGSSDFLAAYRLLTEVHADQSVLERSVSRSAAAMTGTAGVVSQALAQTTAIALPTAAGQLGTQLALVSRLIAAGLPSKVYGVSLGGFDSHAGETSSYQGLLKQLDAAVSGFFKSLDPANAQNTVMFIYSEFGRRVVSNASGGSDHGAGGVAFAVGPSVKGGFYGDQPSLTSLDENGSLLITTDFRSAYATLIESVLGMNASDVISGAFTPLPFV